VNDWFNEYENIEIFNIQLLSKLGKCLLYISTLSVESISFNYYGADERKTNLIEILIQICIFNLYLLSSDWI
jgi:hypothetical protein